MGHDNNGCQVVKQHGPSWHIPTNLWPFGVRATPLSTAVEHVFRSALALPIQRLGKSFHDAREKSGGT
jgi:hypothetical protein